MQYRRLGSSGLRVSEVGLGSWLTIGSKMDLAESEKLVRTAHDAGVNFFDTADVYANGEAEEMLGRALRPIARHHVVLASKCFFPMSEGDPNDRGLSRKHLFESVEGSLRRLGTDYLDLHQCHRFDPETPLEETVRAYEDLIRQGKLLYWGVSQWTAAQITEACRVATATGAFEPISNQPVYSIMRRAIEREVLPVGKREGVGQVVFSPLAQGVLTGKYGNEAARPSEARAADPKHGRFMGDYLGPSELERVARLRPVADAAGLSMAQLAIAWCLRQPTVASAIVGATRESQLADNVAASGRSLDTETLAAIDALFPPPA